MKEDKIKHRREKKHIVHFRDLEVYRRAFDAAMKIYFKNFE